MNTPKTTCLLVLFILICNVNGMEPLSLHVITPGSNQIRIDAIKRNNPFRRSRIFLIPGVATIVPSVYLLGTSMKAYKKAKHAFDEDKSESKGLGMIFFAAPVLGVFAGTIATAGSSFCIVFGSVNWHLYAKYNRNAPQISLVVDF